MHVYRRKRQDGLLAELPGSRGNEEKSRRNDDAREWADADAWSDVTGRGFWGFHASEEFSLSGGCYYADKWSGGAARRAKFRLAESGGFEVSVSRG